MKQGTTNAKDKRWSNVIAKGEKAVAAGTGNTAGFACVVDTLGADRVAAYKP